MMQEEDRVVIIRFGHDADPICMQMDEVLASVADPTKNFAVIYLVDITEVCCGLSLTACCYRLQVARQWQI
jgi:U5 snRNP protein, DIM1 family